MKKALIFLVAVMLISALIIGGCTKETSTQAPATTSAPAPATTSAPAPATTSAPAPASTSSPAPATTSAPAPGAPKYGGTIRVNCQFPPPTGNIGYLAGGPFGYKPAGTYTCSYYETLLRADSTGKISPWLATSYKVADDLSSITLTLRQGVKFHDGSDFNATVAKWNLDQGIENHIGELAPVSSVDIVDDYTIRLNVSQYSNTLLYTLANASQESKATFDAQGGGKAAKDYLSFHPVGTGPFKFVSYDPNVLLKVAKFDGYWQKGKPYLDAIEFSFITDPQTRAAALEAGEIDLLIEDLSKVDYDLVQKGFNVIKGAGAAVNIFPDGKNESSPFHDVRVRQAVDYAIDRDAIVKNLGYGFMLATYQFCSPSSPAYVTDLAARTYDPEKAKQLLADAGYPKGFKTSLRSSPTANRDAVVAVQGYLSKVGIDAPITALDMGAYTQEQITGWQGLAIAGAMLPADPEIVLADMCMVNAAINVSIYRSQDLENLYLATVGTKEFDPELMKKQTRGINDAAAILPIYIMLGGGVFNPYVKDPGCCTGQVATGVWTPENCWLDK
jgi:peptide/nickel transport system substrate-binding protein